MPPARPPPTVLLPAARRPPPLPTVLLPAAAAHTFPRCLPNSHLTGRLSSVFSSSAKPPVTDIGPGAGDDDDEHAHLPLWHAARRAQAGRATALPPAAALRARV